MPFCDFWIQFLLKMRHSYTKTIHEMLPGLCIIPVLSPLHPHDAKHVDGVSHNI